MFDFLKKDELVNIKHLNELLQRFNKKEEVEEKKVNTWLIVALVALGVVVAGAIIYKVFFSKEDYDDYDDFDDDFDDMDYDDDYDDFDDFEDEEDLDDIEDDIDDDLEDEEIEE